MRLGLSQVSRKLRKKFKAIEGKGTGKKEEIYFFDDEGNLVAKEVEGQIVQFFVETKDGEIKLLVLVKGLKRKVDQNLSIISATLVFGYEEGCFLRFVKSRGFSYEKDVNLEETSIKAIANIEEEENKLYVTSDCLGVTEVFEDIDFLENTHVYYIISEKTKQVKEREKR